jgi:hypothetical protein
MPITRYYPISATTTRPSGDPTGEQSASFPWGNGVTAYTSAPEFVTIGTATVAVSPGAVVTWNSLAQTARQSAFIGHLRYRLGPQNIAAGTWSFAAAVGENNTNANSFFGLTIYVWRPSTGLKIGTIYDAQVQLGTEWNTTTASRLFSVSGSAVNNVQNGDLLIVEMWQTSTQAMATAYPQTWNYNAQTGNADFSANGQTSLNSWMDAPDTLVPFVPATAATLTGTGTYTGQEPTVSATANQQIATGSGDGLYSGFVAAILAPIVLATGLGVGTFDGYAPTVTATTNTIVETSTGAGSYTGLSPTIVTPVAVATSTGSATLTGYAPTAATPVAAVTQTGALTASGFAPIALTPVAALPGSGSVLASGLAPTVTASDNIAVATGSGAGLYAGLAPTVALPVAIPTATGAGLYAGQVPAVVLGNEVICQPGSGTAVLTGYAPTVTASESILPGTGQGTWTGLAPTARVAVLVATGTGSVTAIGYAPTLNENLTVATGTGSGTFSGFAPAIALPVVAAPATAQVQATGYAPIAQVSVLVTTATGIGTYTGLAPVVVVTANVFVSTGTGAVQATGLVPFIVNPKTADPGTGLLNAIGYAPLAGIITRAQGRDLSAPYAELVEQSGAAVDPWDVSDSGVRLTEESAPDYAARDRSAAAVAVLDSSQGRP